MINEVIILAGGLGTRLREAVPELPKCMAPVNGKPFIAYVIDHFQKQGVDKFIFALGYKNDMFESFLSSLSTINYQLSIEQEPLGTGGAIKLACSVTSSENVLVTNGDTLFKADIKAVSNLHEEINADCTLCLKPMQQFDRYGVVELNNENRIASFKEKQFYESGYINGGLYALNKNRFLQEQLPDKFSFEKDYLETLYNQRRMFGIVQDEYFIDIGIPQDYAKAQVELS
jgi:D-glycero-alpha-D-manno-heptose 1-phosphate guanylyltransferase